MTINVLISEKIQSLDMPDKMKIILKEVLEAEEQMKILGGRDYKNTMSKILQKYADDDDVKEFCNQYAS